ncbi:hypothetical protein PR048_030359 [Dryococelus australis]|uniref:Transposase n=1 Tax=Dryococelus australis TaxID=614101 RepID=A0ABQ9G988_9NEOP|nr:hypothetical protein PR048_030359 [Dryococelus australis]
MIKFLVQRSGGDYDSDKDKITKRLKVFQKFCDEYTKEWPCLLCSSLSRVFCSVCGRDFSVAHGGRDDCRKHVSSTINNDFVELRDSNMNVTVFFINSDEGNAAINGELLFTTFLVEHNLPLACRDHAGQLLKKMFPDSKISSKYGCARTKTGALIRSLTISTDENITETMKSQPFSLATDGSNDINDTKLYPIVVSYFDMEIGHIATTILTVQESHNNTEGIFKILDGELKKRNIQWENCVLFYNLNPKIHVQGCACHLVHLAARKGSNGLENSSEAKFLKLCQKVFGKKTSQNIEICFNKVVIPAAMR